MVPSATVDDLTHRIVRRLRQDASALSRNRNFHTFTDPKAFRALRLARHLRALEADVLRHPSQADSDADRVVVRVTYPHLKATRTAYLSRHEYDLLLEDPQVSVVLA